MLLRRMKSTMWSMADLCDSGLDKYGSSISVPTGDVVRRSKHAASKLSCRIKTSLQIVIYHSLEELRNMTYHKSRCGESLSFALWRPRLSAIRTVDPMSIQEACGRMSFWRTRPISSMACTQETVGRIRKLASRNDSKAQLTESSC
jgi:hypothetical protein